MVKIKSKIIRTAVVLLAMLVAGNVALASEVTGTLTATVIVAPTASPVAGTYNSTQSIVLTAAGSSSILYTIGSTTPTCSTGSAYSGAISVSSSETINAVSCYLDSSSVVHPSNVVSFAYTINIPATGGGGPAILTPPTPTTTKAGDANGDGKIDKYDFALMMANWGKTGTNTCDFNSDGKIDKYDFALLMSKWGL